MAGARPETGLSDRLRHLRSMVFGERGRAAFARALGVSPSTYNYYEKGRSPPADLLARAAEVTGADLKWLLTGTGDPFPETGAEAGDITLSHQAQEILGRLSPGSGAPHASAAAQAALRALLARMEKVFPAGKEPWHPQTPQVKPTSVPVLGRTAAGIPAPWERFFAGQDDPRIFESLVQRLEGKTVMGRSGAVAPADPQYESDGPRDSTALLVQLSAPTAEGIVEYVDLPGLGPLGPGAFALRVDGDSMSPRILDGDIVVSRRDAVSQSGQTAIVKIRGRIGVTVKLWRPEGDCVHLIPINESHQPTVLRRSEIVWASRVLWVVRL